MLFILVFIHKKCVQSQAINFGRQGHSLTQLKMLHCKTVANIITYHHVVDINCHFFLNFLTLC
jgi:hypothetical protein